MAAHRHMVQTLVLKCLVDFVDVVVEADNM